MSDVLPHQTDTKCESVEKEPSKCISGSSSVGVRKNGKMELKWIHLRYYPPGLIFQYVTNTSTKVHEKLIDLLDFNHCSSVEDTAKTLVDTEPLFTKKNKTTLIQCLQKLKFRSRPNLYKKFGLRRSVTTHKMPILCACLSRDGSKFATSSFGKTCKLWNAETCELIGTLHGHYDALYNCVFNTEGDKVLTGSYDGTVRLWAVPKTTEVERGDSRGGVDIRNSLHVFHGAQGEIAAIECSLDGLHAVAGSTDKTARVFDLTSGKTKHTFEGHRGSVTKVQFDRSCESLLSGSSDGQLGLWDLRNGKLINFLQGHSAEIMNCAFDFNGSKIVSCALDKLVNVWDLRSTGRPMIVFNDNMDEVWDVKFNSHGRLISSGAKDGRLMIWDIRNNVTILNKEVYKSPIHQLTFNAAGTHILTCCEDSVPKIWFAENGSYCQSLNGGKVEKVLHGYFDYLGDRILTVSADSTSQIWE